MNAKPFEKKNLFLTYPQFKTLKLFNHDEPQAEHSALLKELRTVVETVDVEIERYIIAKENHKESGYHYHVYLQLSSAIKSRNVRLFDIHGNHPNIQKVKFPGYCQQYCKKDGDFITDIDLNQFKEEKKSIRTEVCQRLMNGEQLGDIAVEHPQVVYDFQKYITGFNLFQLSKMAVQDTPHPKGIWIYGESGVGKSRGVRQLVNNLGLKLFLKPQNKWWDGYGGEPIALLDDLDTPTLGHYLKIWLDHYACTGEVKGATVPLVFKYLFITSNFSIEHLFVDTPTLIEPIRRRCQVFRQVLSGPIRIELPNLDVAEARIEPPVIAPIQEQEEE